MNDIIIKAEDISFSYTESPFLNGIETAISHSRLTSLVGPNGAGKTTLLYLIAGILKPSHGTITLKGENISEIERKELAKSMAVIPAELNVPFSYTVQDIVEMGRYPYLGPFSSMGEEDHEIVQGAMKKTGVDRFNEQPFNLLSSGEKQRTIIARALAQEPDILLMDEPTVHLDLHYQVEIYKLLQDISHNENTAVFMISHDLNFASRYSDEIILFNDGKIIKFGTPQEIMQEELIAEVYKTDVSITLHPLTGHPTVWPK